MQLRAVTDVNSRQNLNRSTIVITCDFLGINSQLIPVSFEYRSVLHLLRSGESGSD